MCNPVLILLSVTLAKTFQEQVFYSFWVLVIKGNHIYRVSICLLSFLGGKEGQYFSILQISLGIYFSIMQISLGIYFDLFLKEMQVK